MVRIKIELDMEYADFRTIEVVAGRLGLDPESTIRFLLRKGLESLIGPLPAQQDQNLVKASDLVGTEVEAPSKNKRGGDKG